jgi:hypothetical protein
MAEAKSSKLEKALDLKQKYEALIDEARDEALANIQVHLATLKELGFDYEVVQAGKAARAAKSPKFDGEKKHRVCGICGQVGHNARTCPKKAA